MELSEAVAGDGSAAGSGLGSASQEILAEARRLGDEELFAHALETDAAPIVARARLDALAAAGLYGLAGPQYAGGLGADRATFGLVVEALAGGCLTTAFVWAQHHSAVRTVADTAGPIAEQWLGPLCSGALRAGVAFGSLRRPGPPMLAARDQGSGFVLDGTAPWVTGWGRIDVVHVAARTGDGRVVWALVDAEARRGLSPRPLRLAAVAASSTVALDFHDVVVSGERVTRVEPLATWRERDDSGLRANGSLALGVAGRCARLLDDASLHRAVDTTRVALDAASTDELPGARAAASRLALRSASRLVVAGGGSAMTLESHAQRLAREALFLLVFGQTASIRAAQQAGAIFE